MWFLYCSAQCQEARAVAALRAEVAAVRAAVGHHAAILEAVRGQVAAAVAAGARHQSINTGSMSETLVSSWLHIDQFH